MTAFTATQGFIYATGGDSPAATAGTVATLVGQMDAKAQGYDTDAARAVANNVVKVSISNFSLTTSGASASTYFDTTEVNRGTSTDLTLDNQNLVLGSGLWMIGAEVIWSGTTGNSTQNAVLGINGNDAIGYYFTESRDAGTSLNNNSVTGTFTGTMQAMSISRLSIIQTDGTKCRAFFSSAGLSTIPIVYLTAWAFKLGDL